MDICTQYRFAYQCQVQSILDGGWLIKLNTILVVLFSQHPSKLQSGSTAITINNLKLMVRNDLQRCLWAPSRYRTRQKCYPLFPIWFSENVLEQNDVSTPVIIIILITLPLSHLSDTMGPLNISLRLRSAEKSIPTNYPCRIC